MTRKPESDPRVIVIMSPELLAMVEAYQRAAPNGVPSRSEAIRALIKAGAKALLGKPK